MGDLNGNFDSNLNEFREIQIFMTSDSKRTFTLTKFMNSVQFYEYRYSFVLNEYNLVSLSLTSNILDFVSTRTHIGLLGLHVEKF